MSTEQKTVSLAELIKKKAKLIQKDDNVINLDLHVERLGGNIKLSFTKTDVRNFLEVTQSEDSQKHEIEDAGHNLIYTAVAEPNLRDKEVQEAYECDAPTDIVARIFTDGEQADIANFIIKEAGFNAGTVQLVDDLKN